MRKYIRKTLEFLIKKKLKEYFNNKKRRALNKGYITLYLKLNPMLCIILTLIIEYHNEIGLFNKMKYYLNDFILLNNYRAVHLINDVNLLKSRNVKQIKLNKYIKANIITFTI